MKFVRPVPGWKIGVATLHLCPEEPDEPDHRTRKPIVDAFIHWLQLEMSKATAILSERRGLGQDFDKG